MSLSVSAWQGYWEEDIPAKLGCTNILFQQEELPAHRQEFPHFSLSLVFFFFAAFLLHTLSDTASHMLPPSLSHEHNHSFTHTHTNTEPHLSRYATHTLYIWCLHASLLLYLSHSLNSFVPKLCSLSVHVHPFIMSQTHSDRVCTNKARRVH